MQIDPSSPSERLSTDDRTAEGEQPRKCHLRLAGWFRRWRRPLRRWISRRSCVPHGEVDDLTQEVFIRLLRYSQNAPVEHPQAYLFRIATNVVNEWRARCRVRLPHDESGLEELTIEASEEPENMLAREWAAAQVRAAVDRLPSRQRTILLSHVGEGLTYAQIAQARGLTYRIVLRDLSRAYRTLRRELFLEDLR